MKPYEQSLTKQTLSIYWRFATKYRSYMWQIYPAMVVAQVAEDVIQPLIVAGIITKLAQGQLQGSSLDDLWLALVAIALLEYGAHVIWNWVIRRFWRWEELIMKDLAMNAFGHLEKMSYSFFANRFGGSLVNQVNKFVHSFERLTDALTWNVFKLVVGIFFTIVILAPKAPLIVLAIIAISVIYVPLVWLYRRRQLPYNRRWAASETKRTGQLADSITNILAVKSFANEKLERKLMKERVTEVYERSMDTMRLNMKQEFVSGGLQRSINVIVIILAVVLAIDGHIQAGLIYLSLTYTIAIMRRLWDMNNTFRTLTRVFGDAHDMTEILLIEPEIKDPVIPEKPRIKDGHITFDKVVFNYPEKGEAKFMHGFNLDIQPGEKVGLVGPSGGGKTTVTKLLLRFMDINQGSIRIDGQDTTSITQQDLRRFISYVPQEPLLFHRSLTDNIRYGDVKATDHAVKKSAEFAHATEFINELPQGFDTLVGERGVKLSGGQKQRVAIARAMLKDAPILVLDEATSALDSESEKLIQDALWKLMEGRTAIVIAHRLSTIQKMDRIVVLEDGAVAEQGTHQELLKNKGIYANLWAHQSGGFIEE